MPADARKTLTKFAVVAYVALLYGFIFLPVLVLVIFSFQDGKLPVPPWRGFTFDWYDALFANKRLMDSLANSAVVALASAAASTALGFLAAYGLARHRLPGGPLIQWLLVLPLFVSYLVIGMGLLLLLRELEISKSLVTVAIGHLVINMPLAFAVIYGQMGDHQAYAERAARDLGATDFVVLWRITIPMLWPAMFAAFALTFTFSWDEFIIAFLLSVFDVTLPVELWSLLRRGLNPQANAAGSLVFTVSIAVLVVALLVFRLNRKKVAQDRVR